MRIDHLVYAVRDLAAGNRDIVAHLGVEPTAGGGHPSLGTVNSLVALGGRQYLELIGPDPALAERPAFGAFLATLEEPDLLTYAMPSDSLDQVARRAKRCGLKVIGPYANSRSTPSGETLTYEGVVLECAQYRGLVPFFIDWKDSPHPGSTSVQGAVLEALQVTHPEPEGLAAIYAALGVNVPVSHADRQSIVAVLRHGERRLTLVGSGRGLVG